MDAHPGPDLLPPLATPGLPGTGGRIKSRPEDFVVEEIPLYPPSGEGAHVHLVVRRAGLTTREVARDLARAFGLEERDVGCAGLKDKVAVVTQAFSLPLAEGSAEEVAERARAGLGLEVLAAARHGNKLRRGHLLGNRFTIRIEDPVSDAPARARAIAAELARTGLPNAFAEQRLGRGGRNVRRGRARLDAPRSSWIARLELSAWQSALFNAWLAERMRRGWLARVLAGDVAKKRDTGGLFVAGDEEAEQARCDRGEIVATGPIYGSRMRPAEGLPGELEREVLGAAQVDLAMLARARLTGSRRAARVFLEDLAFEPCPGGLRIAFALPKGAYATAALREIVKA